MPGHTGHLRRENPEDLIIIMDPKHPRFDRRVLLPLPDEFVDLIRIHGVAEPVVVQEDGKKFEVVDGRQRTLAARLVNQERKKNGLPPVKVPVFIRLISDDGQAAIMREVLNVHVRTPPSMQAEKARDMIERLGKSEDEVRASMGLSLTSLRALLALLSCTKEVRAAVDGGRLGVRRAAADVATLPRDQQNAALVELAGDDAVDAGEPTNGHANGKRKTKPRPDKTKSGRPPMGTLRRLAAHEFEGDDPLKKVTGRELLRCVVGEVKLVDFLADHPRLKGAFEKR